MRFKNNLNRKKMLDSKQKQIRSAKNVKETTKTSVDARQ